MPPEPKGNEKRRYFEDIVGDIHRQFDPASVSGSDEPAGAGKLILHFEDSNHQVYVDLERLEELDVALGDVARFVEDLPFIRFAITEEEVRAARVR
jgi:hypothetical protein